MFARPAFLDRFLSRFPDPLSLRVQAVGWTALVAGAFAALLVLAAVQLDARRCTEVARTRAEVLARTAGTWLDGDAHAGLGQAPEQQLADLGVTLERLLEAEGGAGVVRTLRPKPEYKAELAAHPQSRRAQALDVVLQTGPKVARQDVDYLPEMGVALFEGQGTSLVRAGRVSAFAPVPDSWGTAPAIVWVEAPSSAPLWRRIAFPLGAALFAGLLVSLPLWLARRHARWLELHAAQVGASAEQLAAGHLTGSHELPPRAPREFARIADALEQLRARLEARAVGQPPAQVEAAPASAPSATLGEACEFDLALLLQQLIDPARQQAHGRGVDVQLVFPDGVPSRLIGHPVPLFRALDGLLRQALRTTRKGQVALRVSRAGEASEGWKLRFEVADTGTGIGFKEQQDLHAQLEAAALLDPSTLKDPLQLTSALAGQLGGVLAFESQPGQGSRFAFTLPFLSNVPRTPTVFQPRAQTAFQPPPLPTPPGMLNGRPPHPISSFVPRNSLPRR